MSRDLAAGGGIARRSARGMAGLAAVGVVVAVTAVAASAGSAAKVQHVSVRLTESCQLTAAPGSQPSPGASPGTASSAKPSSAAGHQASPPPSAQPPSPEPPQPAAATVAGTLPAAGVTGTPIQPGKVTVSLELPAALVAELRAWHAASISATATQDVAVTEAGRQATVSWPGLDVPVTALPASGGLSLTTAPAAVPAVQVATAGKVTFALGALGLTLTGLTSGGAATGPATLPLSCVPGDGSPVLGTVRVSSMASASPSPTKSSKPKRVYCPSPKGLPKPTSSGGYGCTYVIGYSDVRKLDGAALIGPGLMNLSVGVKLKQRRGQEKIYSDGELLYHKKRELPPSTATFLAFGFMPTTATMQLTEVGLVHVIDFLNFNNLSKSFSTARTLLKLRIYDVKVNGHPLPVGPDCRAVRPLHLLLRASSTYSINTGGVLAGFAYIPRFTGCGVGENLDPLFTGTISGPGNYVKMTQGNLCTPQPAHFGCPARKPKPRH